MLKIIILNMAKNIKMKISESLRFDVKSGIFFGKGILVFDY